MLEIQNLSTYYYTDDGIIRAVDDVSLKISAGDFFGLVGPSGCGKSTLGLSILSLIEAPGKIVQGKIFFEGTDMLSLDQKQLTSIRGSKISMIFQDPFTCLNPVMSIGEQIAEGLRYHLSMDRCQAKDRAIELLTRVKIDDPRKRFFEYPHQLSGGMRQRVMMAMGISCGAKLLIADEPTTALDVTTQAAIMELLKELKEKESLSVILISHNMKLVKKYCSHITVMEAGKIIS
jgi:ABC-type dipeptide/oligopeptide/nickel transport system ATPase component